MDFVLKYLYLCSNKTIMALISTFEIHFTILTEDGVKRYLSIKIPAESKDEASALFKKLITKKWNPEIRSIVLVP